MLVKIMQYIPSIVVPLVINLALTLLYSQHLSPSDFGNFSLYVTTISLLTATFFNFLISSTLRFYETYRIEQKLYTLKSTVVFSTVIITITITVILLIVKYIFELNIYVIIIIISTFSNVMFQIYLNYYRVIENVKTFSTYKLLAAIGNLGLFYIFLIIVKKELFIYTVVAMYLPMLFFIIYETFKSKKYIKIKKFSKSFINDSLKYGIPLSGVGILILVLSSSDRYLIAYFLDETNVGYYSMGYKMAELVFINLSMLLMVILFPLLIKTFDEKGRIETENKINNLLNVHFFIMVPILFCYFLFSKLLIQIVFPKYLGAEQIMPLVAVGAFFYVTSFYTNKAFELSKQTKSMFILLFISAVINVLLNILLIPKIGINAAGYSTVIAYLLYLIFSLIIGDKYLSIKINFKYLLKVIIASSIMYVITLQFIKWINPINLSSMIICGFFAVIIYLITSLIFKTHKILEYLK